MLVSDREITPEELEEIYRDFETIERRDGVPDAKGRRLQFTAEADGRIIGFVSGLTNHRWFYLSDLWVREEYRGRGLGSRLLCRMEEQLRSIGIAHIYTWTSGFSNPKFYEKHGYAAFTVFEDFFEVPGYHQIGYRKDL